MEPFDQVYVFNLSQEHSRQVLKEDDRLNFILLMHLTQAKRLNNYEIKSVSVAQLLDSSLVVTVFVRVIEQREEQSE